MESLQLTASLESCWLFNYSIILTVKISSKNLTWSTWRRSYGQNNTGITKVMLNISLDSKWLNFEVPVKFSWINFLKICFHSQIFLQKWYLSQNWSIVEEYRGSSKSLLRLDKVLVDLRNTMTMENHMLIWIRFHFIFVFIWNVNYIL